MNINNFGQDLFTFLTPLQNIKFIKRKGWVDRGLESDTIASYTMTKEVIEQSGIEVIWYELKGKPKLEQIFELLALRNFTTKYLRALNEQNPTAIAFIHYFKKRLKEI